MSDDGHAERVDLPLNREDTEAGISLRFMGAAGGVTGSRFLVSTPQARVMVDCGMFQGSLDEAEPNREPLDFDPRSIDAILVTHAHLDHCGLLPVVVREGFTGPIHLTSATAELAALVLLDSAKVQLENARARSERARRRARREKAGVAPHDGPVGDAAPLYDVEDAAAAADLIEPIEYEVTREVAPGIRATFHDAGHILGSSIIVLDVSVAPGVARRIVFSGDVGRPGTPILRDPTAIHEGADYVVMESTYGGREHEPREEAVALLAEIVNEVADLRGVLLIPSFAIGRTQEIVWHLDRLLSAGRIPHLPLYLDSPMASLASHIYRHHPGYYDEETYRLLHDGETPLDYPGATVTNEPDASRAIARAPRPMIVVASSGMLSGGRIMNHLRDLVDDPAAVLLFVGYQGESTLGAKLQGGEKEIVLDGQPRTVRCGVRTISGFSAHADRSELLDWLAPLAEAPRRPRRVFLVHGDPDASAALEQGVRGMGLDAHRPVRGEEVLLDGESGARLAQRSASATLRAPSRPAAGAQPPRAHPGSSHRAGRRRS